MGKEQHMWWMLRDAKERWSREIAEFILEQLANGRTLTEICATHHKHYIAGKMFPSRSIVQRWLQFDDPLFKYFKDNYPVARELQADKYFDETIEIADNTEGDWKPVYDEEGKVIGVKADVDHIARAKLRVETRMKVAARMFPRKYGEKVQQDVNHTGLPSVQPVLNITLSDRTPLLPRKANGAIEHQLSIEPKTSISLKDQSN